jgi:quinol monooxygenase YgiN
MKNERPDDKIIYFQDLTDNQNYIAVARGSFSKKTSQSGWIKSLTNGLTSKIPGSRAFVLDSTLLTGNADLNIDATSAIVIEHVDSDPKMREMNLPLFKQLEQAMSSKPGFKGMQVWTWDNRTNHWTVIEAWDSSESQQNASRSPDIVSLWDKIYGNAAAPNNVSEYRLLTRP